MSVTSFFDATMESPLVDMGLKRKNDEDEATSQGDRTSLASIGRRPEKPISRFTKLFCDNNTTAQVMSSFGSACWVTHGQGFFSIIFDTSSHHKVNDFAGSHHDGGSMWVHGVNAVFPIL